VTPNRDPLAETDRLLVDGTNVLHKLSRMAGAAPPAALIGRLRGVIPAGIGIELVFDGPAERGLRGERIAAATIVRFAGPRTADAVIVDLVHEARRAAGPAAAGRLLVVTDDRDLRHAAQVAGARTAGVGWLLGRLGSGRAASPSIANARAPRLPPTGDRESDDPDDDRVGWRPGRGATTKRGNPRRASKADRAPRTGRTGRMRP
jgi:predicted RNA-binding protein with PIN domain